MAGFEDFVNDRTAYALTHNGNEGFALPPAVNGDVITIADGSRVFVIDDTYQVTIGRDPSKNAITFISPDYSSTFALRRVNLDDAKSAFPNTPRVFTSPEDLEEKIAMALENGLSYDGPADESDDPTVSFTVDGDEALELIKVDNEGNMFYRDKGDWVEVQNDGNYPNIYDRDLIDIEPADVDKAVALWDSSSNNENGVKKSDLLPFAALTQ